MSNEIKPEGFQDVIRFPFRLKSDIAEFTIDSDLFVKRMDDVSKEQLLGIKDFEYDDNGLLSGYTSLRGSTINYEAGPLFMALFHLKSSNYMLSTSVPNRADEFNLALKLIGVSSTSLFTGFGTSSPSRRFVSLCHFDFNLPALTVTEEEVISLKELVYHIHNNRDDNKFQIMSDIYLHAMFEKIRPGSRFLELSIILEMLLLPEQANELSYRFSLRLAKLMNKFFGCAINEVFNNGQKIYKTRSKIVHSGKHDQLESNTPIAHEYVRKLLSMYLKDKTLFEDKKLDALCLN